MELKSKDIGYNIELAATENIKILINDNEVFNETVANNFTAKIKLKYFEQVIEVEP